VKHLSRILFCSLLATASLQAMACYTVYDRSNRVVYQGESPPVDMSLPLHQALAPRFPGASMVFDAGAACESFVAPKAPVVAGGTPLLTNVQTAKAMHVPHIQLAGGIALVQPGNARVAPGVTVLPAEATALAQGPTARDTVITEYRAPNGAIVELVDRGADPAAATRMMGAGPAPRR
jgi:hypothetical protein